MIKPSRTHGIEEWLLNSSGSSYGGWETPQICIEKIPQVEHVVVAQVMWLLRG